MNKQLLTKQRLGDVRSVLHRAGLRVTPGRLEVIEVFSLSDRPVSPEEVRRRVPEGAADRATVYRAVRSFVEAGILHQAYSEGRTSYYELSDHCGEDACHPHFICTDCGSATCFYEMESAPLPGLPEGFKVRRRKLTLFGLCPECSVAAEGLDPGRA